MPKPPSEKVKEHAVIYSRGTAGDPAGNIERIVGGIREGLPFSEFEALREQLGVSIDELAERTGISRSTLARRKAAGRLDKDQSDKVMRFSRIFVTAKGVFENNEAAARRWLKTPQRALGYASPLDFSDTEAGAREVERLLGRIDYGVYT